MSEGLDVRALADAMARAIEQAETAPGPGRVRYVHPDCGFWMLKRSIADGRWSRGATSTRGAPRRRSRELLRWSRSVHDMQGRIWPPGPQTALLIIR